MAYDRELADRIRMALAHQSSVREVNMFGGLSFMVNEKMTVNANTSGDLMLRCDPKRVDDLVRETAAEWAEMRGKPMSKGWLVVSSKNVASDEDLDYWISVALDYNKSVTSGKSGRGR